MKKVVMPIIFATIALFAGFMVYKRYQIYNVNRSNQETQEQFNNLLKGYELFRDKYAQGDQSIMHYLSVYGQKPRAVVVACSDSRVDPALLLQCDPGDLFVIRNVANIVPPYNTQGIDHGTSAALEFGLRFLKVKNLIILGHSECGGIKGAINCSDDRPNDFIDNWVSLVNINVHASCKETDEYAKIALNNSYANCLTYPWIKERVERKELTIHVWFFDIKSGQIFTYSPANKTFEPLNVMNI